MMTRNELNALYSFVDAVEEAGIAQATGGMLILHHEGREFLVELKTYDVTGVEDE